MGYFGSIFKSPRQFSVVVICAFVYAGAMIPFKGLLMIPGISEVRPAAFLPVIFGLTFGPAGAIGAMLGNLLADLFGTFGPASIFGALGNLVMAYVPFRIWLYRTQNKRSQLLSKHHIMGHLKEYAIISICSNAAGAMIIATGVEFLEYAPYLTTFSTIFINNVLFNLVLGSWLIYFVYPMADRGYLTFSFMNQADGQPQTYRVQQWHVNGWLAPSLMIMAALSGAVALLRGEQFLESHFFSASDPVVVLHNGLMVAITSFAIFIEKGRGDTL